MKLYTSPTSPFGNRVVLAARAKNVEIECVRPMNGVKVPEFLAINPIGKIPVLITAHGTVIPESAAILQYLEDRFPSPSLRPADPDGRALVNRAICVMDAYVMAPVIRLFPHLNPARRDQRIVDDEVRRWKEGAAVLAHFLSQPLPSAETEISLADCTLVPSFHLSERIARFFGLEADPLQALPALAEYYSRMRSHRLIAPLLDEMTAAQAEHDAKQALQR